MLVLPIPKNESTCPGGKVSYKGRLPLFHYFMGQGEVSKRKGGHRYKAVGGYFSLSGDPS